MTPALEELLHQLGWKKAERRSPWHCMVARAAIHNKGGLANTAPAAKEELERVSKLLNHMKAVVDGIEELPDFFARDVNLACSGSLEEASEPKDQLGDTRRAVLGVVPGIIALQGRLAFLAAQGGNARGRPPHLATRNIVRSLAEVYIIGTGEVPTYGTPHDSSAPNSHFVKVASKVLAELGLPNGNVLGLTQEFRESLSENDLTALRLVGDVPFEDLFLVGLENRFLDLSPEE